MNVFKSIKTAAIAAVVSVGMAGAAMAVPISGTIDIGGPVTNPTDTSAIDFTTGAGVVLSSSGVLSALPFASVVSLNDVTLDATVGSAPVWVGFYNGGADFISFTITSILGAVEQVFDSNGVAEGIEFNAIGVLKGSGYDDTVANFSFSSQGGDPRGSFSSSTTVPLPASVLLLGGALVGAGALARRRKQSAEAA